MTVAYMEYITMVNTIDQTLAFKCTQNNANYTQFLNGIKFQLVTRMLEMRTYDEAKINTIAAQIKSNDYSWFLNHNNNIWKQINQWHEEQCIWNIKQYASVELPTNKILGYGQSNGICANNAVQNIHNMTTVRLQLNNQIALLPPGGMAIWSEE